MISKERKDRSNHVSQKKSIETIGSSLSFKLVIRLGYRQGYTVRGSSYEPGSLLSTAKRFTKLDGKLLRCLRRLYL